MTKRSSQLVNSKQKIYSRASGDSSTLMVFSKKNMQTNLNSGGNSTTRNSTQLMQNQQQMNFGNTTTSHKLSLSQHQNMSQSVSNNNNTKFRGN
jgi:hypothetical protein